MQYETRKAENFHRDKGRMDAMQSEEQRHHSLMQHQRDNGLGGAKRNASGEHYNSEGAGMRGLSQSQRRHLACITRGVGACTSRTWETQYMGGAKGMLACPCSASLPTLKSFHCLSHAGGHRFTLLSSLPPFC